MSDEKFKFNGTNYKAFKIKLLDFLLLQDLDNVATVGLPETTASDYAAAQKKDRKAQAHIRLKLSDKTLDFIKEAKTSKEILSKLDSIYDRTNIVSLGLKEEEFNSRKFKSNEKLQDYLNDLSRLKSEINDIKEDTVKPHKHAIRILNGLSANESYKNVVSSLYTMACGKVDDVNLVDDITTRLLDECSLFELDKSTAKDSKGSVLKTGKNPERKQYKCWSCGDKDPKHNCKKSYCSVCGKQGHRASKCPEKDKQDQKPAVSMMASDQQEKFSFFLDSGSSHHITIDRSILFDYATLEEPIRLGTSKSGSYITLIGRGKIKFVAKDRNIEIKDVFYSTNANANLLSNSVLDSKGAKTLIEQGKVILTTADRIEFMTGTLNGSLYRLDINPIKNQDVVHLSAEKIAIDIAEEEGFCAMTTRQLHMNLGHANVKRVEKVAKVINVTLEESEPCIDCAKAKITRDSFKQKSIRATRPLELIHSDIGFINVDSYEGHSCFSLFIDDYHSG